MENDSKLRNNYRYKVWIKQANFDLSASKLSMNNGYYEWSCFQSQQSAEKSLKSVIVFHGKSAPKLHRLGVLFGIIKNLDFRFKGMYLDIADLQAYTFASRYPFLVPGNQETPHEYIQREDAELCIEKAERILNLVKSKLPY